MLHNGCSGGVVDDGGDSEVVVRLVGDAVGGNVVGDRKLAIALGAEVWERIGDTEGFFNLGADVVEAL
jgi:hypothetical protein